MNSSYLLLGIAYRFMQINTTFLKSYHLRSYIILGIYSIMAAIFYKWEASLFVFMASIFIELILLFVGAIIVKKNTPYELSEVNVSGAAYALISCLVFIYPMAYMMGNSYGEFSSPNKLGFLQPIVDYKWEILLMAISLGVGYLSDFNSLKKKKLSEYISTEVYRVSFLLLAIGLIGMASLEGIKEMTEANNPGWVNGQPFNPFTKENKMIPILIMISARILIEIWYIRRKEKNIAR